MKVFVESGPKRVFAGAIEWPGWARSGKTEEAALETLIAYGRRYKASVGGAARKATLPANVTDLKVVARLPGGSGTDFGVPSAIANFDRADVSALEIERQNALLRGAWQAVDKQVKHAGSRPLATGPRGGGRTLAKIREHVVEADRAYIAALGARAPSSKASWPEVQEAFLAALEAKLRGELPERGPRGGERWPALYTIRRSAWHALDHAWEIEDRILGG